MQTSTPLSEKLTKLERLRRIWRLFQVSRKGAYSVEAVQAFREYSTKSWIKSFGLLLAVPLPAVILMIGQECIPLASPNAGWKANYNFYTRLSGFLFICHVCCDIQLIGTHSGEFISPRAILFTSTIATATQTGFSVLCSDGWMFPIPFCLLIVTIIGALFITLLILYISTQHNLSDTMAYGTFAKTTVMLLLAQSALLVVYPAFSAVFIRLEGLKQAAFVLVLPIIKVVMKNLIANLFVSMPKDIVHTTVFSVELFNAFYVSMSMQTAVSLWATVMLIAFDALNSMWSLYSIQQASQKVLKLQNKVENREHKDLLSMVLQYALQLSNASLASGKQTPKEVERVKKSKVSPEPTEKPKGLVKGKLYTSWHTTKETTVIPFSPTTREVTRNKLELFHPSGRSKLSSEDQVIMTDNDKSMLLQEAQSLLFRCEYLASLEYVEFVVPFIYIIYMLALFHLPNVKYHANFRHLTEETLYSSIYSIALYGGLELLSFIAFVSYIQWKFGFSPLKLLGFTFEAQGHVVVARSVLILVFVTQFPYPHFGMDLTFQFDYSDYP